MYNRKKIRQNKSFADFEEDVIKMVLLQQINAYIRISWVTDVTCYCHDITKKLLI